MLRIIFIYQCVQIQQFVQHCNILNLKNYELFYSQMIILNMIIS
jgi:hypothetical protein